MQRMSQQQPQTPYQRRSLIHMTLDQNRDDWDANPSTQYGYASNFALQRPESSPDLTRRNLSQDFDRHAPTAASGNGIPNQQINAERSPPSQQLLQRSAQLDQELHNRLQRLLAANDERQAEMQRELLAVSQEVERRERLRQEDEQEHQQILDLRQQWYSLLQGIRVEHDRDLIANWIADQRFSPEIMMEFTWKETFEILQSIPDEYNEYMDGDELFSTTNIVVDSLRKYKTRLQQERANQPAIQVPIVPDERQLAREQELRQDRIQREQREWTKRVNDLASHSQAPKIRVHRAIDDTIAFETFCLIHKVEPKMMVELYSRLLSDVNKANAVLLIQRTLEDRPDLDVWAHKRLAIVSTVMGLSKDNLDKPLADLQLRSNKETHAEFEAKFLLAASIKHQKNIFNGGYHDLADYEAKGMVNLILEFKEKMPKSFLTIMKRRVALNASILLFVHY